MPSKLKGSTRSPHFHFRFFYKKKHKRKKSIEEREIMSNKNQGETHPQQETNSPNKHTRL
jgi:hypothetical protein